MMLSIICNAVGGACFVFSNEFTQALFRQIVIRTIISTLQAAAKHLCLVITYMNVAFLHGCHFIES